jgi:hypothetical protein
MNRSLTEQERRWLIRGLNTLETGEYFGGGNWIDVETNETLPLDEPIDSQFFLSQIEDLRVTGKCNCGEKNCHTILFQHFEMGKSTAIVCYHTEDKRQLIIHINEDSGMLAELEVV